jgi:hypothetical protein
MKSEKGQALPLAILALAVGTLVITPFLSHASSSLIGSGVYGEAIAHQSACDAGVEHAVWNLTRGTLAEQFSEPGDEVTYQLDETLNGVSTTVTVTANATAEGVLGEIADTVIDTLTFDSSSASYPDIINVTGNIFAIAYQGQGYHMSYPGYLKTVQINDNGDIASSPIDTLVFDYSGGSYPDIINVASNIFAIAYQGGYNRGYLKTVQINDNGDIASSPIDTLVFDYGGGSYPDIINVAGNIFAIAYQGGYNRGYLKTVQINDNGDIASSPIDTLVFDYGGGSYPDITNVAGNIFAIAYQGGYNRGYLKTVQINDNGDIASSPIDTLVFDYGGGSYPDIINVAGNIFAIAYSGMWYRGYLVTIGITSATTPAAYEIVSTAGDKTIRAFINTENVTVSIVSWQIQ